MSLVPLVGEGFWYPPLPRGHALTQIWSTSDALLLDADDEEIQVIGSLKLDASGAHTFGTASSLGWLPGPTITFGAGSTLRVGLKSAAKLDLANGPAARATLGAAAFDVYRTLTGGTDTITATTWRTDAMTSGSLSLSTGDLVAVCLFLDVTSGTPSVKMRGGSVSANLGFPVSTLGTSGPTYTAQTVMPNLVLTCDDGTLGWLTPTYVFSTVDVVSGTIGQNNIFGNVLRLPFACEIDALLASAQQTANTRDVALDLYSDPLGTPTLLTTLAHDANLVADATAGRSLYRDLATPVALLPNTDYCIGVRQTTANACTVVQREVNDFSHFKPTSMGAECYAATSTAGATFAPVAGGVKRRFNVFMRVCSLDNGRRYRARAFTGF